MATYLVWGMRIDNTDPFPKLRSHNFNWQDKIGVIRYHNRFVEVVVEAVNQQRGGQINIRSLLFHPLHLNQLRRPRRTAICERELRQEDCIGREPSVFVDREMRDCTERTKIDVLPCRSLWIMREGRNGCSEVPNLLDLMAGEQCRAQCAYIEPLERCLSDATVVEIESVDVDACGHCRALLRMKRPPRTAAFCSLPPKRQGRYPTVIIRQSRRLSIADLR